MHLSSWHYVILDFQAPVLLTDFIIPPCKALGSIMISIWGTAPELEHVIAYSDEISSKALIMSNLVEPISLQYLKVCFYNYFSIFIVCKYLLLLLFFFAFVYFELYI